MKKTSFVVWLILVVEFLYIFAFLMNYDFAWVNQEKFGVHQWILSNGSQWHKEDWTKFLNINVIECNPYRLSRPLSNFVEVVDTKFRAWLWNFIPPHPSLSLQWPFMFILLPWLLYQTFVNMGCYPFMALAGACLYISSPGFLGPLVMLFHPAKSLANFFGVLSMYFFSINYKREFSLPKNEEASRQRRGGGVLFIAGLLALYLAFISDETGLYMYVVVLLLFFRLWLRSWQEKRYGIFAGLLAMPILYWATIKVFLPYLHWAVMGVKINLASYESYPSLKSLFWPNWHFLWLNTRFLFADHPHLLINYKQLLSHPLILSIQIVYVLLFLWMVFLFFRSALKNKNDPRQIDFLKLTVIGVLLLLGYCFFQTFQLSKNAKAWGIWWYGSLFSLIYTVALVFFLQFICSHYQWLRKWSAVIIFIFVLNTMTFTTYRLAICKMQNLNRTAYSFMDIFKGRVDPYGFDFDEFFDKSYCRQMYTYMYWLHWKGLPDNIDPRKINKCFSRYLSSDLYFFTEEDGYLPAELGQPPS
ncbi:MAG: hypothetical protein KGJ09_06650 [Candidatus Omnitrophica bacterium]|nr:hypothetical protein [Candidatus Omnitrophota bacterium]MDE2009743.1 hypothetical protein [Candidatus Omnitrophota bacterium]MDE2213860.1 hypothetical protein [Candidatus Omnitrophota bacterium]MDE2231881.1 hypothetical protein [Candidatus Omnitrophota bacterium]